MKITLWIVLSAALMLAGCSIHESPATYPVKNLKTLTSHSVPVAHGQVEYYRFGSGSPLVLIPGYATDVSSWDKDFLAGLATQHQVIVLNIRNVGRSQIASDKYACQDLANDIYQLIAQLHLKKPAVLGISMGGMIAQQLAVMHADKIGQLILINTVIAGKQAVAPTADIEKKMQQMPSNQLQRYIVALELFFPASSRMQMAVTLAMDRFQPQHYVAINAESVMPQQRRLVMAWVKDNSTAKEIRRLNLPTLILNGGADAVIPPVNSLILAHNIANSELIRWQNGGHAMIYQYPVGIANRVNDFILLNS